MIMTRKFKVGPLTVQQENADGIAVYFGMSMHMEEDSETHTTMMMVDMGDYVKPLPVQTVVNWDDEEVAWTGTAGSNFVARRIMPSDAAATRMYGYDLPVPVILATLNSYLENPMQLQAIVDSDDDRVMTLLLATDAGLYARYDTLWFPVTDPEVFEGSYMIDVSDNAIQLYDAADVIGGQIAASALTGPEGEDVPVAPPTETLADQSIEPEPMSASGTVEVPIIENEEQLQAAIVAATDSPGIRWYVEKRASALGVEVEFPW